ncbi:MAG: hypothetical protein HPY85_11765 [Anaerolineae bacterium]|nr:hypothetical protein [Anaerolineae bacterium]
MSSRVRVGDLVSCGNCKTVFRVVWLYPLEIDWLDMNENPGDADAPQSADAGAEASDGILREEE